ncbi:unnamed protein product [Kuraishia capsulata CBS 1993]|uniref:non-specific serine/threonine protein kinase n=1 Tax=Kuraishia capsulata CBS 1993 TaxID=1382522 RepID=W6MHS8_9ASCO|nr:uncharacterized protein KUCA_T00001865001 [Kuraishia capsulata CBS 1993]CDK25894.1 unnamed protein product [Kuraishia capsulata CBS 1993]
MPSEPEAAPKQSHRQSMSNRGKPVRIHREVRFGAYVLGSTLGEGEFGKVKLGWRKDGKQPSQAAIKLIRRDSIPRGSERENKVHREISALKRLAHPNIVRLEEVLQNEKYIGIVLEYASGGELFDYILEHKYLKDSMACRLFAQLVSGVDYMHSKGLVHRDLKLENLLLDKHRNVIISDFGFVNSLRGNEFMKTSCGSPCYAAPELVVSSEPYEARKVDVWSCGIILYAMLAGYLPFDDDPQNPNGDNIARLYQYITHSPLTFPEYIQPTPRDLLRKIIVPDPRSRVDLKAVRSHSWLTPHAPYLSVTPSEWDRNYRSSKNSASAPIAHAEAPNRRYSLMENPSASAASFVMNKANARSYSTQNVAQLYSNPAAPQTSSSHAIALPTSSSTTSVKDMLVPSPVLNSGQSFSSVEKPEHRRTGSASVVLKAVVDADAVEVSRRNSVASSIGKPRSRSGSNAIETIQESPKPLSQMLPPAVPKTSVGDSGSPIQQKFPTRNKPRPTSYHPSSSSSSDFHFSAPMPLSPLAMSSETSLVGSPIIEAPSPSRSEKRNSWTVPKIPEPHVDLSSASGVLTPLLASPEQKPVSGTASADVKGERRKSAIDSLSNAIDQFSLVPSTASATATTTGVIVKEDVQEIPDSSEQNETLAALPGEVVRPLSDFLPAPLERTKTKSSDKENKQRPKRFSILGFYGGSPQQPKKALEPTNVHQANTNANHSRSRASRRMSVLGNANSGNGNGNGANGQDSAARRVIEFFKRRSVRI